MFNNVNFFNAFIVYLNAWCAPVAVLHYGTTDKILVCLTCDCPSYSRLVCTEQAHQAHLGSVRKCFTDKITLSGVS